MKTGVNIIGLFLLLSSQLVMSDDIKIQPSGSYILVTPEANRKVYEFTSPINPDVHCVYIPEGRKSGLSCITRLMWSKK